MNKNNTGDTNNIVPNNNNNNNDDDGNDDDANNTSIDEKTIAVFGATGFVGRHVCRYLLASIQSSNPENDDDDDDDDGYSNLQITLAGRSRTKLESLRNSLLQEYAGNEWNTVQQDHDHDDSGGKPNKSSSKVNNTTTTTTTIIMKNIPNIQVANSSDYDSLYNLASTHKCIINCAGPFAVHGSLLVQACAKAGTDYVDITGEVDWVAKMRQLYGKDASRSGARIVSMCGFDSIPSDLSVYVAVQTLRQETSGGSSKISISDAMTWHYVTGAANGGTLHTMLDMSVDIKSCFLEECHPSHASTNNGNDTQPPKSFLQRIRSIPFLVFDPYILSRVHPDIIATTGNKDNLQPINLQETKVAAMGEWLNILKLITYSSVPAIRNDTPTNISTCKATSIPFFMAVANAKVVQASARALSYYNNDDRNGQYFTYQERQLFLHPLSLLSRSLGPLMIVPAILIILAASAVFIFLKLPFLGKTVAMYLLPPGSGLSDSLCELCTAQVTAQVTSRSPNDGKEEQACCCTIEFQGDPGNLVTAQCVSEAAMCMLLKRENLPPAPVDGFGTPAVVFGDSLVHRLKQSKVRPVKITSQII